MMRIGMIGLIAVALLMTGATADEATAKLQAIFGQARQTRVAVVGIGDSNQRFGGHGWSAALASELQREFGSFGSELRVIVRDEKDPAIPAEWQALSLGGWFLAAGTSARCDWRKGALLLPVDHPMDLAGPLRFHLAYGITPGEEGAFRPAVRLNQAPWTVLLRAPQPSGKALSGYELQEAVLDLPEDATRKIPLMFSVSAVTEDIRGPFFGSALWAENLAKKTGCAYHTLYARGGQSLFDILSTLRKEWGRERVSSFFRLVRQPLGDAGACVVMICSGLNDLHEKEASIGPHGGYAGISSDAYEDNLRGMVAELQAAWASGGGAPERLRIVFMPSHPVDRSGGEPQLAEYRARAEQLAAGNPQLGFLSLPRLITQEAMAKQGYYDQGAASSAHLAKAGYEELAKRAVALVAGTAGKTGE